MIGDSYRNSNVRQGDPVGMHKKEVFLSADNVEIDCRGVKMLVLTSDNTTATNRTFTLTSSNLVGHELFILFTTGSSMKAELANSGTCRLAEGAMTFTQYKSIRLVSDGTYWYEQVRGANTGLQASLAVSVVGDAQAVDLTGYSAAVLTSDNATATSRTITLTASATIGHIVTLSLASASNKVELLAASTTKLTKAWYPNQYDTITLISDGTNWIEIGRTQGAGSTQVVTEAIIGDNQAVVTVGRRYINIDSDSATATGRTFTLAASNIVGQELTLVWTHATNRGELVTDSTTKLSADWRPAQYDALFLVSDGTRWVEVARSLGNSASSVASVTLSSDNQAVATEGLETVLLTSDNATATARTFTVTASPRVGQKVTLVFISATNRAELAVAATMKILGDWRPAQYDTLTLVSDGTRWIEQSRSYGNSAANVASVALVGDAQAVATEGLETIILTSDNATAANRTFTLTASPRVGHRLLLLWNSANEGQLEESATQVLVSVWEPTNLYQTLSLVSDGTRWIEVCRADPT